MSKARWLVLAVVLLAVCAAMAAAQSGTSTYQQSGNLLGANANVSGPTFYAGFNLSPQVLPDARNGQDVYIVNWFVTTFTAPPPQPPAPPGPPPGFWTFSVTGVVAVSGVKQLELPGGLSFDLDISKLEKVLSAGGVDCTTGTCTPLQLDSFPLKGTISPVIGAGAVSFSRNGNDDTRTVNLVYESTSCSSCEIVNSFNGAQAGTAANFVGTIGEKMTIVAPTTGANGFINVRKGLTRSTNVCTPCLCPFQAGPPLP